MNKEKIQFRNLKKPDISAICPPKMMRHVSPSEILNKPYREDEISIISPPHEIRPHSRMRIDAITPTQWFIRSENIELPTFKNHSEIRTQSLINRKKSAKQQKSATSTHFYKRSPYLKNQSDIERILSNLKPMKGPTDSLIRQIKKHNDHNIKNTQQVLMGTKDSFKDKIMKYSSRIGLRNNEKIFVMNSKDVHIREALISAGWVQGNDLTSTFFHLKWVYTDNPQDYSKLQQGQFYNHFKNNQQLTNKNLFRKNIQKHSITLTPNYPVTFDLQANDQLIKFQFEYKKFQAWTLIEYFMTVAKDQAMKMRLFFQKEVKMLENSFERESTFANYKGFGSTKDHSLQKYFIQLTTPENLSKSKIEHSSQLKQILDLRQLLFNFCYALHMLQNKNPSRQQMLSTSNQLQNIIKKLRNHISKHIKDEVCFSDFDETTIKNEVFSPIKQNVQICLQKYSHLSGRGSKIRCNSPIDLNANKKINDTKLMNFRPFLTKLLQIDKILILFIIKTQLRSRTHRSSYGLNNWWIIKPAGVSRGTGIKLQSSLNRITNNIHGKIVQKYIQKPLILKCGRKFDIRQWVLVKSFLPLSAYIFKFCYSKFCANKYTFDCSSPATHLTNYSQQKNNFHNASDSALSQADLELQMNEIRPGIWPHIKKQIKTQIIQSLLCVQNQIDDKNQCFQVFGFDLIIDESFKVWVLQCNMSPACEKRSQFLQQYLKDMGSGVVDFLEGKDEIRGWQKLQTKNFEKITTSHIKREVAVQKIQNYFRNKFKRGQKQVIGEIDHPKPKIIQIIQQIKETPRPHLQVRHRRVKKAESIA